MISAMARRRLKSDVGKRPKKKERPVHGVITAFFSMILLLLIVLILTMAEGARLAACSSAARLYTELSAKSLLAGYYLPLYENYHVFGRYCPELATGNRKTLSEEAQWLFQKNAGGRTWVNLWADDVEVDRLTGLTQRDGELYFEQAVQYEKYRKAGDLLDSLLQSSEELRKAERVGLVMQRAMAAAQSSAEAENTLFQLLSCVDGFETNGTTLIQNIFGQVQMKDEFCKRIVPKDSYPETKLLVNMPLYWAQSWYYCKIVHVYEECMTALEQFKAARKAASNLAYTIAVTPMISAEGLQALLAEIDYYNACADEAAQTYRDYIWNLYDAACQTKRKAANGQALLADLKKEKEICAAEEKRFLEELENSKMDLPEEIYQSLRQEHEKIYESVSAENSIGILQDISGMEKALLQNEAALEEAIPILGRLRFKDVPGTEEFTEIMGNLMNIFGKMDLDRLAFSYGDIKLAKRGDSIRGFIKQFVNNGLLFMVLEDVEAVSDGKMSDVDIPGQELGIYRGGKGFSLKELFDACYDIWTIPAEGELAEKLGAVATELTKEVLFAEYLADHFACYPVGETGNTAEEKADSKWSVTEGLKYQREFILFRGESDRDNLADMVSRIFLMRFAMNAMALYSNAECRGKIQATATAIMGFTGIGALIALTELLITMLWAAECALVETACLMRGKDVNFLVTPLKCMVSYEELLLFSKEALEQKVKVYKADKERAFMENYQDYLYLLLFLRNRKWNAYGAMDVVQQMLRIKYDDRFRMKYCICGVSVRADVTIPYLFLPVAGIGNGQGRTERIRFDSCY